MWFPQTEKESHVCRIPIMSKNCALFEHNKGVESKILAYEVSCHVD